MNCYYHYLVFAGLLVITFFTAEGRDSASISFVGVEMEFNRLIHSFQKHSLFFGDEGGGVYRTRSAVSQHLQVSARG